MSAWACGRRDGRNPQAHPCAHNVRRTPTEPADEPGTNPTPALMSLAAALFSWPPQRFCARVRRQWRDLPWCPWWCPDVSVHPATGRTIPTRRNPRLLASSPTVMADHGHLTWTCQPFSRVLRRRLNRLRPCRLGRFWPAERCAGKGLAQQFMAALRCAWRSQRTQALLCVRDR